MREAAGVFGSDFAMLCVYYADAVDKVFGLEFDEALRGAA